MTSRNWNRSELARRAGLSPPYVTQLLNGTNKSPGLEQLEALAKALDTTVSRLLAGPEDKPNLRDSLDAIREAMRVLEGEDDAEALKIWESLRRK